MANINPQYNNSINNTELNQFNVIPTFGGTSTAQEGINLAPTFNTMLAGTYFSLYSAPSFAFKGLAGTNITISNVYGLYSAGTFAPVGVSTGTMTLTTCIGVYSKQTAVVNAESNIATLYGLGVELPTGATANYTAYLGTGSSTLVGIGISTPNQALSVRGGVSFGISGTSAIGTYIGLGTDCIIDVITLTSDTTAVVLPAASSSNTGQFYVIKDVTGSAGLNNVVVSVASSGTIDGSSTQTISTSYGSLTVYSNGTSYSIWESYNSSSSSSAFTWVAASGTTVMSTQTGYYITGTSNLVLPISSAAGTIMEVALTGTYPFTIGQRAGQVILFGNTSTTVGTGGSITSSSIGDALRLLCTTGSTVFQVLSGVGNLLVT